MLQYQIQKNNFTIQQFMNLKIFKLVVDEIYKKISPAKQYYPDFENWYYANVIPSILNGDKEFIFEIRNGEIVGLAIIKHSEKKLCHLSIFDEYKNKGYGLKLFEKSFQALGTNKPYLTVSEEKYIEFKRIFNYYGFKLKDKKLNAYRKNKYEYYFNTSSLTKPSTE
jgi:hypothetical protein